MRSKTDITMFLHGKTLQDMFCIAAQRGIDSEWLAKTMMTSDFGVKVMKEHYYAEWASPYYMLDCLEQEIELKYGKVYPDIKLEYAAFLYKFWVDFYDTDPREVYSYAPLALISDLYFSLHTEDWEWAVNELKEYTTRGEKRIWEKQRNLGASENVNDA